MITNTNNFLNNETMESCKNNVSLVISKILRNHFSNDNSTVNQIDETIYKIDENQKNILIFIAKILSSLSITGIFFVIFIFTFCRSVRSFVLELAVWLCATHLIFDICLFFPNDEYKQNWCVFIGVMCTFSYFSTNVWTTLIGFFSYYSIIKSSFIDKNKKYLRLIFITIAYFIPCIFIMIVCFYGKFGVGEIWCWIDNDYRGFQYAFYILLWITAILNSIFVILLIIKLKKLDGNDEMIKRYISKIQYYPITQIVCLIPKTINLLIYYFDKNFIFWMLIIQIIFDSLAGLIFSILFGFNPNVIMIIYEFKDRIFSKKKKQNPLDIEDASSDSSSINRPIIPISI